MAWDPVCRRSMKTGNAEEACRTSDGKVESQETE